MKVVCIFFVAFFSWAIAFVSQLVTFLLPRSIHRNFLALRRVIIGGMTRPTPLKDNCLYPLQVFTNLSTQPPLNLLINTCFYYQHLINIGKEKHSSSLIHCLSFLSPFKKLYHLHHLLQPHEISARQFCASENQVAGGTRRYQKLFSYLSSKMFWRSLDMLTFPKSWTPRKTRFPTSPLKPPPRLCFFVSGARVKTTQKCKAFVGAGIPGIPSPEPAVGSWFFSHIKWSFQQLKLYRVSLSMEGSNQNIRKRQLPVAVLSANQLKNMFFKTIIEGAR